VGRGSGVGGGGGGNKARTMKGSGGAAQGLTFERTPGQVHRGYVLVQADVGKLDRSLARDAGFHVGPGGTGGIPGRYGEAAGFLGRARAGGIGVHATEAGIDRSGQAYINDGRHRFAAIRDSGAKSVPIAVRRGQAARFGKLFGPSP